MVTDKKYSDLAFLIREVHLFLSCLKTKSLEESVCHAFSHALLRLCMLSASICENQGFSRPLILNFRKAACLLTICIKLSLKYIQASSTSGSSPIFSHLIIDKS